MNKAFRTIWNDVRQSFVTTSEIQTSHGKRTKSSLSLCIATALFTLSGVASAAYVEPGVIGSTSSWETPEYQKDWGLEAMNASAAYSLGYNGQKTALGMMDSGALLYTHPELDGERFRYITQQGKYTSTGNRYPQGAVFDGAYTKDESFDTTGKWILGVNDSHGTHVLGTIAANRDGANHHGVAWNSTSYSANTGGSDDSNYGPFLDYGFFYNGWKTLADALVKDNGKDRGGVINNSFGTNIRVYRLQQMIGGNWTDAGNLKVSDLNKVDGVNFRIGPRLAHIPTNTVAQAEYEYFLHNKIYGAKGIKSFVDAAWDAVKGTNVVQVFTTGNRDMHNPFYRPLYPYFNPEAENNWVAVAGLMKRGDRYELISSFNEAGLGKYWTVAAPGSRIYSSAVVDGSYVEPNTGTDSNGDPVGDLGSPSYQTWGGTSMAAPHVTGAMGVLMSRYQSMTAPQVRDVMFTTANHKNPDGTDMVGWENVEVDASGAVVRTWAVPEGEVSNRMGWGVPDLNKGMYGPGQLLGKFDYNMNLAPLDVWTNDISEVALKQREREDLEWMAKTKNGTDASTGGSYELGNDFVVVDGDSDATNHVISEDDAQKWRSAYFLKRAQAIQNKIDNNLYQGSLVKRGSGMLIMTGNNTYSGGTTVEDGALYGFSEAFGSGNVNVNGGVFGVLSSFNDNFTQKGQLNSLVGIARAPIQKANIVVNNGGTYAIVADQDVQVGNLTFNPGSLVTVTSLTNDAFEKAYDGIDQVGTVTADKIEGFNQNAVVTPDYALVDHKVTLEGNTLTGILTKSDKTLADYALTSNGVAVANALMADSNLLGGLADSTKSEARKTIASLANDIHVTANAMTIANGQSLVREIKDQAIGIDGSARVAEVDGGRARLWMSTIGNWSKMDRDGASKLKSDFYTGLIGLEADINVSNKVGIFFGAGKTKFKGGHDGKIDSKDFHFGIYGQSNLDPVRLSYGFAYTHQDRDSNRVLFYKSQGFGSSASYNAKLAQVFGEAAYTGLNLGTVNIEPYVGLAWMHLSADDFSDTYAGQNVKTKFDSQNLAVTNVGTRVKVPFEVGAAKFKAVADVNWTQFMGDTRGKSNLKIGSGVGAKIQSDKLSSVAAVGLGLEAQLAKRASLGVSYYGAYGSKIKSNGVGATFKFAF